MIAHMHIAGHSSYGRQTAITERLLAEACGVDSVGVEYLVLEPLGHEAAISRHSADVWVRHEAIAKAVIAAPRRREGRKHSRAYAVSSPQGVRLSPPAGRQDDDLYAAAYIARFLKVPDQAIAAAEAAVEAQPKRLSYLTSLVSDLRVHGHPDKAQDCGRRGLVRLERP